MTDPNASSAIARALEQIRRADQAADALRKAQQPADQMSAHDRTARTGRVLAAQAEALRIANSVVDARRAYDPVASEVIRKTSGATSALRPAQENADRVRNLSLDPDSALVRAARESPIAAAARKLAEEIRRQQPNTLEDAETQLLRQSAEAAGLSPRGAAAYARDQLSGRRSPYYGGGLTALIAPSGSDRSAPDGETSRARRLQETPPDTLKDDIATDPSEPSRLDVQASVKPLGARLRQRRLELGLTQEGLATAAGVGRRFICELESGKETVELGRALRVFNAVQLTLTLD